MQSDWLHLALANGLEGRGAVGEHGQAGAVGGMLIAKVVGYVLEWTGSYLPIFIIAGSTYLTALLLIHLLVPRFVPAPVEQEAAA